MRWLSSGVGWGAAAGIGLFGCSVVLDPDDYLAPGGEPPPPAEMCRDPIGRELRWASCPMQQQGPAALGGDLGSGDLALAAVPGGDSVPSLGAIGILEMDGLATVGTFRVENIDESSGNLLNSVRPIVGARSLALRAATDTHVAINVLGAASDDPLVVAWHGSVDSDMTFQLEPIGVGPDDPPEPLPRSGIAGGLPPGMGDPRRVRHVWRDRQADGRVFFVSLDEYGSDLISSDPEPAPTLDGVDQSDTAGAWTLFSTPEAIVAWNPYDGGAAHPLPTDGRTGAAALAYGGACVYLLAYPQDHRIALRQLMCDDDCTTLRPIGGQTVEAGGLAGRLSLSAMPGGGWVLAFARHPLEEPWNVGVILLDERLETVGEPITLATPPDIPDHPDLEYRDVRVAAVQRMGGYHVLVAASVDDHDTTANPLRHWIAALHGCAP